MSRYIRVLPLRSLALQAAIGLTALSVVLLLTDPGGVGTLLRDAPVRPVLLLWLLVALAVLGAQFGAARGLPGNAKPVPVRAQPGIRRLPR